MSRVETLLNALVNGETADIIPQSRNEEYLLALINCDTEVKEPRSRMEAYLHALCKNGVAGGGSDGDLVGRLIAGTETEIDNDTVEKITEYAFALHTSLVTARLTSAKSIGGSAFSDCSALTTVDCPSATNIGSSSFYRCNALKNVNLPLVAVTGGYTFSNCKSLQVINLPLAQSAGTYFFQNCLALEIADFSSLLAIGTYAFQGCSKLKAVILRSESTMCSLASTNAFSSVPVTSLTYFYVPRIFLSDDDEAKDYRRATNFATYSTRFRALEDYSVDGTIYGELDLTKI